MRWRTLFDLQEATGATFCARAGCASAAWPPAVGRAIPVALLRRGHTEPGARVQVGAETGILAGQTVPLPLPEMRAL